MTCFAIDGSPQYFRLSIAFPGPLCYNVSSRQSREGCIVAIESGGWIMRGLRWDDPCRIRSWQELIQWVDEVGFLPLFKNFT